MRVGRMNLRATLAERDLKDAEKPNWAHVNELLLTVIAYMAAFAVMVPGLVHYNGQTSH